MVDWAMRYGNPSIASRLDALQRAGCDRILIVPLYPQYCAATSATVADKAFDALKTMRWQPAVRIAPPWHDDPVYIEAVARLARSGAREAAVQARDDPRVVSRHAEGLSPQGRPLLLPVPQDRAAAARAARLDESKFMLTFQSRFGTAEWLQPYTDKTVKALAEARREESRHRDARASPPIASRRWKKSPARMRRFFTMRAAKNFAAIPCLNDSEAGMTVIAHVVLRELEGLDRPLNRNPRANSTNMGCSAASSFQATLPKASAADHILAGGISRTREGCRVLRLRHLRSRHRCARDPHAVRRREDRAAGLQLDRRALRQIHEHAAAGPQSHRARSSIASGTR